jgi:phosphopantetheinyl transferase
VPLDHTTLALAGSIGLVWLDLDQPHDVFDELALLLDESEEQRVSRLAVATERLRAIVRFARRRQVFADILKVSAKDLEAQPVQDAPGTVTSDGDAPFVSSPHCEDVGLIAVTRERKVGVDVEAARWIPRYR